MHQRILTVLTSLVIEIDLGRFDSQYLVGAFSPWGHSISSHSGSGRCWAAAWSTVTRTRAKRDCNGSLVPSRQHTVPHAEAGNAKARPFTLCAGCCGFLRQRVGTRPVPVHGVGGKGPWPGPQILLVAFTSPASRSPS